MIPLVFQVVLVGLVCFAVGFLFARSIYMPTIRLLELQIKRIAK